MYSRSARKQPTSEVKRGRRRGIPPETKPSKSGNSVREGQFLGVPSIGGGNVVPINGKGNGAAPVKEKGSKPSKDNKNNEKQTPTPKPIPEAKTEDLPKMTCKVENCGTEFHGLGFGQGACSRKCEAILAKASMWLTKPPEEIKKIKTVKNTAKRNVSSWADFAKLVLANAPPTADPSPESDSPAPKANESPPAT